MLRPEPSEERLCWRSWPCRACGRDRTPIGHLLGSNSAGTSVRAKSPEQVGREQADSLLRWVESCPHHETGIASLPRLTVGSEHIVYLDERAGTVVKLTWPGIYGDSYYLDEGRVYQRKCSPVEYLVRLRLWDKLFAAAPEALGITAGGQIVSRQPFILGDPPSQDEVNAFIRESDLIAVKESCWLWKRSYEDFEVWVGDARADNFVLTSEGMVPIDIRLWFAPANEFPP